MHTFPDRLKFLRNAFSLTQKSGAAILGVTLRSYQRYEDGSREPKISDLISLANYFGVSLDYLTGRDDDPRHEVFKRQLFYNPEGELFYVFKVEDTMQPDFMKCKGITLSGHLKYTFGVFQHAETKQNRYFLYLDAFETSSIYPYLFTGRGHLVFIAFASFLTWKLGFQYNPYDPGNKDIIISSKTNAVSQKFISIGMTETSPSRLFNISDDYSNYIKEYLKQSSHEKVESLSNFFKKNI